MPKPMPAIFFGHGNPMNALMRNAWTDGWVAIGKEIQRPRAVLSVSAHWYLPVTLVTAMAAPRTIHDFGGFPRELYEVKYPAPGDPDLARRIRIMLPNPLRLLTLSPGPIPDGGWGLSDRLPSLFAAVDWSSVISVGAGDAFSIPFMNLDEL
jgi:4,5-DOPA dioxygenase extradiol